MSIPRIPSETFVLRLVRVEKEMIAISLRSSATGEQTSFGSIEELAGFLKSIAADLPDLDVPDRTDTSKG